LSCTQGSPSLHAMGRPTPQVFVPAGAHVPSGAHVVLRHSVPALHGSPSHFLAQEPPQSAPVSLPSCTPLSQAASLQVPVWQLRLTQSVGPWQGEPAGHRFACVAPHRSTGGAASGAGVVAVGEVVLVDALGAGSPGSFVELHAAEREAPAAASMIAASVLERTAVRRRGGALMVTSWHALVQRGNRLSRA
jgi:hypothetical protein